MSNGFIERLDSETRDVINYLRNRSEICDLRIDEIASANQSMINEWEIKNLCSMPLDLKSFYLNQNGLRIEWKFAVDSEQTVPLGKILVNPVKELTRVSTALHKNLNDPSLFDLDDIQIPPNKAERLASKSLDTFSSSSALSLGTEISTVSHNKPKNENESEVAEIFKNYGNNENDDSTLNESSSDENDLDDEEIDFGGLVPHFGETSNNFELDNCNGYGKVCLVYKSRKTDLIETVREQNIKEHTTEIWFLDRSLQWHYITDTFQNYYRLLIAHLGLPQWQSLFTDDGLPPFLYQWYYMLCPGRILIHDNNWQKLQFLTMFENNPNTTLKGKNQATKPVQAPANNKIDFAKLFDDKAQK